MPGKEITWTEQQLRAIRQRGSDVLVSASAGTGKTAVLSGRCVDVVGDKTICPDVWSVLVLTFTDMAAEQMRSRIAEQLRQAWARTQDPHFRRQLVLLQGADISTIHSFCKRLITEHFFELGLDPTFRVVDSDEATLLKAEALEATIDWAWQQSHLQAAMSQLLYRRDLRTNEGFPATIMHLSDFLDGVVWRTSWYDKAAQIAETVDPLASGLGQRQKETVAERLRAILHQLHRARKLYEEEVPGGDWAARFEDDYVRPVAQCLDLLQAGDWHQCAQHIRSYSKPRFRRPKDLPEPVAKLISKIRDKAMASFADLSSLAVLNPDYLDRLGASVSLQTRVLIELVRKFDHLYSRSKRSLNCLDFADLEQYALRLLTEPDRAQDDLLPSETALALRRRYRYVFVDEYQDINPVQKAILEMLSSKGQIFAVGDVKQSIYAFRGAEPAIFTQDLKFASLDPAHAPDGLRVDLNENFRSAKAILDFVNRIFSRIMTPAFASIDYDESAHLRPAPKSENRQTGAAENIVEFHILDETSKDDDSQTAAPAESEPDENINVVTARQRQAAMIARRIRQMVGAETGKPEFQIYDKQQDKFRAVEYRDIVILMRSLAKKANDYVEILRLAGVPVSCQSSAGYFETTEITDMVALLKVLDNPQRDIELAAVLRSPFFKLTDTELAKIKLHGKPDSGGGNFYNCVVRCSMCGGDAELAGKLGAVLGQIEQWRTVARRGHLADLIWRIYRQTGFLSFVSALPNGQARRANLLKLHDRAIQFEGFVSSAGIPSLKRFVEFIERLQATGQDWTPAEPEAAAGNAVRILSVHKSKGLEFPIVFLAELDSRFNMKDVQADVLADADYTLGLQIIDCRSNARLSSLAHQVIAESKLARALAEEMRILYVATTRARERLILTASQKQNRCRDIICDGSLFGDEPIPDWQLRACQAPLDWILYGLCDQKALHDAFESPLAAKAQDDGLFSLQLHRQNELEQLSRFVLGLRAGKAARHGAKGRLHPKRKPGKSALLAQVRCTLAWRYGHGDAPRLPAKQSVTALTHRSDEYMRFDYSRALQREPAALLVAEGGRAASSSAAWGWLGTATHLVLARLDLTRPVTTRIVRSTVKKLLADGALTDALAESINTESIAAFFASEFGRMALDPDNTVWREWPFTFALDVGWAMPTISGLVCGAHPTSDERRATSDESIVVQGIIDMLIRTPNGLLVIDFKTDQITPQGVAERAELYRRQLELYSRAAGAILKEKLISKWLYFLTPGRAIEVE